MINPLIREEAALLVVDVQERLFPHIAEGERLQLALSKIVRGCAVLDIPIMATEQVPEKMGPTLEVIKKELKSDFPYKSTFSCMGDAEIHSKILKTKRSQWIVCGIEAHVCVLQTVRDLLTEEYDVVVVRDAVSSRSTEDYFSALEEMRDFGARISTSETVLFELLQDAKATEFKKIRDIVK